MSASNIEVDELEYIERLTESNRRVDDDDMISVWKSTIIITWFVDEFRGKWSCGS